MNKYTGKKRGKKVRETAKHKEHFCLPCSISIDLLLVVYIPIECARHNALIEDEVQETVCHQASRRTPPHSNLCISYQCSCFPLAFSGMPVEGNGQGHHAQVNQSGQCCSDSRGLLLRNVFFFSLTFLVNLKGFKGHKGFLCCPVQYVYIDPRPPEFFYQEKWLTIKRLLLKGTEENTQKTSFSFLCRSNNFLIELNKAKRPLARALYNQIP